ncbi:endonuclease III [Treponema sp.]|uniref:endonuclease III n=1 Tax=Treponema sp. TaxID=166 RepID=UPI003F076E28
MKLLSAEKISEVFLRFQKNNPSPASELVAPNSFCLLVSVVLSAQTTDKAVNKATAPLYKVASTPEQMLSLGEEKIRDFIKSIGLYRNKARHVVELSRILVEKFNSEIPDTREVLESLPGVGRKTANVVLNVVYHQPTMPVDTHLLRICPKIGLAEGSTPLEVERSLLERIPSEFMMHAHHWLILHGRYVCTARNPRCADCPISDLCLHNEILPPTK